MLPSSWMKVMPVRRASASGHQLALAGDDERVDLGQRGVVGLKAVVEVGNNVVEVAPQLARQAHALGQIGRLVAAHAEGRIDVNGMDLIRRLVGHFLDVHAARGRGHDHRPPPAAVNERRQVKLLSDATGGHLVDQHLVDRQPLDLHPQDVGGALLGLVGRGRQLDATRLAPAAGQHLGLDDHLAAQVLGNSARLFRCVGHFAARDGDAVFREQPLGLILV